MRWILCAIMFELLNALFNPALLISICIGISWAEPCPGQEWVAVSPVRQLPSQGLYGEIQSRLTPAEVQHYAVAGSVTTSVHEMTHGVNARVRNERGLNAQGLGSGSNALYVYGGYAAVLREPPVTIQQVAAAVPKEHRLAMYRNYLVDPTVIAHWNDQPLYLLDEMVAYLNGAIVGCEMGTGNPSYDFACATELQNHAVSLYRLCLKLPAGTYDVGPLREFVFGAGKYMVALKPYIFGKQVSQVSHVCGPNGCPSPQSYTRTVPIQYGTSRQPVREGLRRLIRLLPKFPRRPLCPPSPTVPPAEPGRPPVVPATPAAACDLSEIKAELAELRKLIEGIERGAKGDKGDQGDPGVSPELDYKAIVAEVMTLLPPIHVRRLDVATGEDKVEKVHLGEGFTILNFPPE